MKTKKLIKFFKNIISRTKKNKLYKKRKIYTKRRRKPKKLTRKNKNVMKKYNFSNEYLCRWCGSMHHKTNHCVLN